MVKGFDDAAFRRQLREAERKAQREIDKVNRENRRRVDAYNREVDRRNKRSVNAYNGEVARVNNHNRAVIADLNRQLRSQSSAVRYTESERGLADRVQSALAVIDQREWDAFLSYARIDGAEVGETLCQTLGEFGVTVWFDAVPSSPARVSLCRWIVGLPERGAASRF
ncbi:MAG: hypothetical protein ACT4PP_00470 [Sporichthyaceae bacterium]